MLKKISEEANNFAKNEIKIFNLPTLIHYELSMEKAIKICEYYPEANPLIVQIGIALMDCKLGETFKKKIIRTYKNELGYN